MKKFWLGIGMVFITILLLLQTRFTEFLRLDNNGYAVGAGRLKQLLVADPNGEDFAPEDVALTEFEALDMVYRRGDSYYLGEKKKTQIDLDFPMLINDGSGLYFTDNETVLFDVEFEEEKTYRGLMLSDKVAYNPNGERADANEYLFAQFANGIYSNLTPITFEEYGEEKQITMNSFISFRENYFTYYEPVNGIGVYYANKNVKDDDILTIDGEEYTYRELLLLLHALSERKERPQEEESSVEEYPLQEEIIREELPQEEEPLSEAVEDEILDEEEEEDDDDEKEKVKKEKKKTTSSKKQTTGKKPSGGKRPAASSGGGAGSKQQGSMGVRPDSARPDKNKDKEDEKDIVENYVKPEASVEAIRGGVFRIMVDVKVDDPASRLNVLRKVQFEFYEVLDGGKESLVYRTHAGNTNGQLKTLEAGSGNIEPGKTYRVSAYMTYFDEYNESVVEPIELPNGGLVTTLPRTALGSITLMEGSAGNGAEYLDIPVYYDNKLVLTNVAYNPDPALSDPEAVYAIDNGNGITLLLEGLDGLSFNEVSKVDRNQIAAFKSGELATLSSTAILKPNSHYKYTIQAVDFGEDALELIDSDGNPCSGEFYTCKSRPVGDLTIENNQISDFKIKASLIDPESSAIDNGTPGNYDVYLVIATKEYRETGDSRFTTWEDCQAYIDNGNKRVQANEEEGKEEGKVHFLHKFDNSDIVKNGEIDLSEIVKASTLDLGVKYHAYLLCDFDLNNMNGPNPQYHQEVAYLKFTSASLSSLGSIYIKVDVSNVAAHSAVLTFTLNDNKTNEVLTKLLSDITFAINDTENETTDAELVFDPGMKNAFTGYYKDETGEYMYVKTGEDPQTGDVFDWVPYDSSKERVVRPVLFDENFFNEQDGSLLKSMTEYKIEPDIKALYNGKKYDMKVVLTTSGFKTMREPATVVVENDIFAAGTLRFDVTVNDPDDAICGNSGHVVVMNVYDYNRNFIKAVRIPKNQEKVHQEIAGLDSSQRYFVTFVAVEYNEGYTNATYESNKVLSTHYFDSALDISGTIKLQNIEAALQDGVLTANTKVVIKDPTRIMNNEMPYFISVTRDGEKLSTDGYINYKYGAQGTIEEDHAFLVDKGKHTYTLTLYIRYNENDLILDTLTFTTEDVVVGISSAQEFVEILKKSGGKGRYVITGDIDLIDTNTVYKVDGADVKPVSIVSNFEGQIDFQGYTLSISKKGDVAGIFTNIGPKGEIANAVFNFKAENGTRVYDKGMLCNYNYGHIHDVIVNFKGGTNVANQYFGLLCRYNTTSGIIERFVINNDPEEGMFPFTARNNAGLVAAANKGIIRDGYVYGEDIYAAPVQATGSNLYVGGIVGYNLEVGRVENVFSLVNIMVPPPQNAGGVANTMYAAVSGTGHGSVKNVYSIGQSTYTEPDSSNGKTYDSDSIGPTVGSTNSAHRNIYYWNEKDINYPKGTYQTQLSLESLHDYNWQKTILGSAFDVQPVEVGFYPQVIMNEELPQQELIPLPQRDYANLVEIMSATVLSYADDGNSAEVEFRLSNTRNVWVEEIKIDGLTVTLDTDSVTSADGFTTIRGTVSEPTKYVSSYEITEAVCNVNGFKRTVTFKPAPLLLVDFYRDIYDADDWYEYVVQRPTENARLANDIDFTGVKYNRIRLEKDFTGKLSGGKKEGSTYGYSLKNIDLSTWQYASVFTRIRGEVKDLGVENLTLGGNRTTISNYTAFAAYITGGTVKNVHFKDVTLSGHTFVATVGGEVTAGSLIQDCTINNVTITYKEQQNKNSSAYVGGLAGKFYASRMQNCYVRDITIEAGDLRGANGIGGIIGDANDSTVDSVYVTGSIDARAVAVGGVVGKYVSARAGLAMKNMIARVDVTTNKDIVGGLVGWLNISEAPLHEQANMTGIAFGNVFCSNTDAEEVSYTAGSMVGYKGSFYGTDFQLLNGLIGVQKDDNTRDLLTYEQVTTPSVYTDSSLLNMDACYDYSKVSNGYMPALYYADGSGLLPFQDDIPISLTAMNNNLLEVTFIDVNTDNRTIWMDVAGPAGYKISAVTIEDLKYSQTLSGSLVISDDGEGRGTARVVITYDLETAQDHFLDSYNLVDIAYQSANGAVVGHSDFRNDPIRVPLTLYKDIYDLTTWNAAFTEERNFGDYENYRIVGDINFDTNVKYAKNLKVGRLVGNVNGKRATLSNIKITEDNTNLIFRLNSELSNINFTDCSVDSKGRDNIGLIGASSGYIYDVNFENITIDDKSTTTRSYIGIIAYQQSGGIGKYDETKPDEGKVVLKNVTVGQGRGNNNYTGGLAGYASTAALITNVEAEKVNVRGQNYVGGIIGASGKISIDGLEAADMIVSGVHVVGGVLGYGTTGYTTINSARMMNISISGTPTYDEDGNIISSTTTVGIDAARASATNSKYVGGVFGYIEAWGTGFSGSTASSAAPIHADGIVVQGYADGVGGIAGWSRLIYNATIENSLITVAKEPTTAMKYFGGVVGAGNNSYQYLKAVNCQVRPVNFSHAGLVAGYLANVGISYGQAENSSLVAKNTLNTELQHYGGVVGYATSHVQYCTAYNCIVDASDCTSGGKMTGVGGVAGHAHANMYRSFYYADPISAEPQTVEDGPWAKEDYYVKGTRRVGGVIGSNYYASGIIRYNYSNANVIATDSYAGGFIGAYENGYVRTTLNGSDRFTYAACELKFNYFAGTVEAKDYAGGFIGCLGMANENSGNILAKHLDDGGRNKSTETDGGKSGTNNETEYTAANILLAKSVKTTEGSHADAFAGNFVGFEGSAYYDPDNAKGKKNQTALDKAKYTHLYAGTTVQAGSEAPATELYVMKNGSSYRYMMFGEDGEGAGVHKEVNARLIQKRDLEYIIPVDANGTKVAGGYRGMKWFDWSADVLDYSMRGDWHRMITKDVDYNLIQLTRAENTAGTTETTVNGVTDTEFYQGKSYLPHVRINTGNSTINDWLLRYQSKMRLALPIPQGEFDVNRPAIVTMNFSLRGRRTQTYGTVYQSDVDKINLEFSEDLLFTEDAATGGYFILYSGDEVVDCQLIHKRVYTYNYDYQDNLKLCYGYADTGYYKECMEAQGLVYGQDYVLHDIFEPAGNSGDYLTEISATDYNSRSLEHHVMTYGEKYYYIDDAGVWSGTGSSVVEQSEGGYEDASAQLMSGNFITLYNGMALKTNGDVISMTTGETVRSVSGITPLEKDEKSIAMPLQSFVPAGVNGVTVETYAKFSEFISTDGIFRREEQYIQSALGSENVIDAGLTNVKDSVVQYNKDGNEFCTILGTDGIMIDMYNGDELNAPEDFRSSGIVYMTNNMHTTAPFILVEYQNGGIVGYNYMTGEYLFDHSVSNEMSLLDYMKVYFEGDKSQLEGISQTYAANAKLAKIAGSPERLASMVTGVSEGDGGDDVNTGEDTMETKNPEFAQKAEDGSIANNAADGSELPEYLPGMDKAGYEDITKDAGADPSTVKDSDKDTLEAGVVSRDGDVNTTATGSNTSGNDEDVIPQVTGDSTITGEGSGDGADAKAGDKAVNGTKGEDGKPLSDEDEDGLGADGADGKDADAEGEDADADADADGEDADADDKDADAEGEDAEGDAEGEDADGEDADADDKDAEGEDDLLSEEEQQTQQPDANENPNMNEQTIVSTSGTEIPVTAPRSNIDNGDTPKITSPADTGTGHSQATGSTGLQDNLITVYNAATGTYEIVDKTQYFTNKNYYSENVNLNIKNLSNVYNGFAEKEPEKKQADGLGLYIFVTLCALGGIGGTLWYRKKHKMRF